MGGCSVLLQITGIRPTRRSDPALATEPRSRPEQPAEKLPNRTKAQTTYGKILQHFQESSLCYGGDIKGTGEVCVAIATCLPARFYFRQPPHLTLMATARVHAPTTSPLTDSSTGILVLSRHFNILPPSSPKMQGSLRCPRQRLLQAIEGATRRRKKGSDTSSLYISMLDNPKVLSTNLRTYLRIHHYLGNCPT